MHSNFILNTILVFITTGTGYISANFQQQLQSVDLLLSPIVKLCSIASFICFLILNWSKIKNWFKKNDNKKI